jgi:hypothetical protein
MEKRILTKTIGKYLIDRGYTKVDTLSYSILSKDESVKFIIRIPDMTFGFLIGAQLDNYGEFDGKFKCAPIKNYEFELLLNFASCYNYSENEMLEATQKVCERIDQYVAANRSAITNDIDSWAFGSDSERVRNEILVSLGLPPIDPYSDDCLINKVKELKSNYGSFSVPLEEYVSHKSFYDRFADHGCKIYTDDKSDIVMIMG